jgi:NDP-sugar pyrophosphorylase family protein
MKAVILAGGLGKRLRPLTKLLPKPLLPLGESNVLETQIRTLKHYGFNQIYLATNYKAKIIKEFLGDGQKYKVNIIYSKENKPLGTCGPLSLLKKHLNEPFILVNGDILSNLNLKNFFNFSLKLNTLLTAATVNITTPFDFGIISSKKNFLKKVTEKPKITNEILAGIYFFRPDIFKFIPNNKFFGIDTLINRLIKLNIRVGKYRIVDFWLDIGQLHNYNHAKKVYKKYFSKF